MLVLLHAFPLDSRMWDGVRDPLAKRLRLVTPDLGDGPPDLDAAADQGPPSCREGRLTRVQRG
jgi:hypothetical protein